jgi:hypothetical protein
VTFIAKAFTYFSQHQDGPEEKSLRAEAESLINVTTLRFAAVASAKRRMKSRRHDDRQGVTAAINMANGGVRNGVR